MGFAEREKKSLNKYLGGPRKKSINKYPGFFQNIFSFGRDGAKAQNCAFLTLKEKNAPDF